MSIRRRLATFHIDLFSNPKSLRSPALETFSPFDLPLRISSRMD
ncbi:hypothetical protein M2310_007499 [Rhizobium leguminosarum]|nr:hypothetical protein [Rhizobium leguminosarum]